MTGARDYLDAVAARLTTSPAVMAIQGVSERDGMDRGYFRARLSLSNGDFLEVSEYFVIRDGQPQTLEYRYQWMDGERQALVRRWDNARHFPHLPGFPNHVHMGGEERVVPGSVLSILDLIDLIEQELGRDPPGDT